jgi:branched-chain amino acid transport system ATP-binding protein
MTAARAPLLSCRDLTKRFGALAAVKNLSFEVWPGQTLGIGGPNGGGKTTLFDVISGATPATSGSIVFDSVDVTRRGPERICHLGLLRTFQFNAGFDSLTIGETVLAAWHFGRCDRRWPGLGFAKAARAGCDDILAMAGLFDVKDAPTQTLPVFERKLLMIASALAANPKLLLLDEPAGGLIPKEMDKVADVIETVRQRGVTIVLIEHVMRFLMRLSSKVMILHHGEKLYEGSPDGVARDATVVEVYLGAGAATRLRAQFENGR